MLRCTWSACSGAPRPRWVLLLLPLPPLFIATDQPRAGDGNRGLRIVSRVQAMGGWGGGCGAVVVHHHARDIGGVGGGSVEGCGG